MFINPNLIYRELGTTLLALLIVISVQAQPFNVKRTGKPLTFKELQLSFDEWKQGKDLRQVKGWKYYKRWEWYYEQRLDGKGNLPDPAIFINEAINASQKSSARNQGSAAWTPVGPASRPVNPGYFDYGMGRINCIAFHPTDSNTWWVGVAQGGVWKTTNSGQTWTPLTDQLPVLRVSDIAVDPNNPDVLYVSLGDYAYLGVGLDLDDRKRNTHFGVGVYKTINGGLTWNPTGLTFNLTDFDGSLIRRVFVDPSDSQHLVAAGIKGIWVSTDGGATWVQKRNDLIWDLEKSPADPNILYASGGYVFNLDIGTASILKSTDFGNTWTVLPSGIPEQGEVQRIELTVSSADPNYVYAIACDIQRGFYAFYQSSDAGASWTETFNRDDRNLLAYSDGMGEFGGQGTYDLTIIASPTDKHTVFIGGINVWGTTDGGYNWDGCSYWLNPDSPHPDQHFFAYNPLNQSYFLCNDGGAYRTKNIQIGSWQTYTFPTEWEYVTSNMQITSFYRLGVCKANSGAIVAGSQDNSTYYRDGTTWNNIFGGDGMECFINPLNPDIVYGSSQYGSLYRSDDGGQSDYYISPPEEGEWTTPWMLDPVVSTTVYAALGNLWKSDLNGENWVQKSNFPVMSATGFPAPASALAISASNTNHIYIAKRPYHSYEQPAEVWKTSNGGTTWQNITAGLPDSIYMTYITVHDSDPNTAWISCSGFFPGLKIFKTTNGGITWTNVSKNLPNLPVNCVLHQPGTSQNLVYIATDIGVYYTTDALNEWIPYSTNLPNVIITELEIHAATQKLYASTFGRGVWMTDLADPNGVESASFYEMDMQINPSVNKGSFHLSLDQIKVPGAKLNIINILGNVIHTEELNFNGHTFSKNLNLTLKPGMYFLAIENKQLSKVARFIVE